MQADHQRVEAAELRRRRLQTGGRVAVEAVDRDAVARVGRAAGDAFEVLRLAGEPVLRTEQRGELHVRRRREQLDGGAAVLGDRRRVRDQPDPPAPELPEPAAAKHLQTAKHLWRVVRHAKPSGSALLI